MMNKTALIRKHPQITLMDLLVAVSFLMPVYAVFKEVDCAGGGALRYVLGIALALVLGVLIVRLSWMFGTFFSVRYGKLAGNLLAPLGLWALEIVWIIIGFVLGNGVALLLVKYVPQQ